MISYASFQFSFVLRTLRRGHHWSYSQRKPLPAASRPAKFGKDARHHLLPLDCHGHGRYSSMFFLFAAKMASRFQESWLFFSTLPSANLHKKKCIAFHGLEELPPHLHGHFPPRQSEKDPLDDIGLGVWSMEKCTICILLK